MRFGVIGSGSVGQTLAKGLKDHGYDVRIATRTPDKLSVFSAATMSYCGNDAGAKAVVASLLQQFGWDLCDLGTAKAARAIEPLCQLWCIPGFLQHSWGHAFRLLRP